MNGWGFPGRLHGLGRPEGPDRPLGASSPHGQMGRKEGAEEGDSLEGVATPCPLPQPCSHSAISGLPWAQVANAGQTVDRTRGPISSEIMCMMRFPKSLLATEIFFFFLTTRF